jgi:signal transduction histidine kinase
MYTESMKQLMQMRQVADKEAPAGGTGQHRSGSCGHDCQCNKEEEASCAQQTELRWMASQLLAIQENERKRIAADLHDGLGQSLTMIKLALAETEQLLASGSVREAAESLRRLRLKAHDALEDMRHVAMDLRPPMLDDLGILPTLSWFFREIESVCQGLRVEKNFNLHENNVPGKLKITIFRIIQEATSNIIKYANADLIQVHLRHADDALHFSISDNGEGFDPSEVAIRSGSDRGLGLMSMKERAHLSGGDYVIDSVAGRGTRIHISWKFDKLLGRP